MATYNRIPPGSVCYRDGKTARYRERDPDGNDTGRLICKDCYNTYYRYGIYEKPEKHDKVIYVSIIISEGKLRKVIVDNTGGIINRNPTNEELKGLIEEPVKKQKYTKGYVLKIIRKFYDDNGKIPGGDDFRVCSKCPSLSTIINYFGSWNNAIEEAGLWNKRYNPTHTCDRCRKSFDDIGWAHPVREYDEKGDWTGNWDCPSCYEKYDPNSLSNTKKSVAGRRTGNIDQSSTSGKGYKGEKLLCKWKGFINLNDEDNNYNSPIDCQDPVTKLYYQAKIAYYDPVNERWSQDLRNIQNLSIKGFVFKSLFLFCISEDGNEVEMVLEIPEEDVIVRMGIFVAKNPSPSRIQWYKQYVLENKSELKKLNEIWKKC